MSLISDELTHLVRSGWRLVALESFEEDRAMLLVERVAKACDRACLPWSLASGLGALLTAFTKNQSQAGIIGSAVSLVFGALGGNFVPAQNFSGALNVASKLTLNRWAMDGLIKLTIDGGGFSDILPQAAVLAVIGLVTYLLAIAAFRRRFVK